MIDELLRQDVDSFAEENRENIFRDIARLVSINSVNGPALPGKPFGEGPALALDAALQMAQDMGFETKNCEGMIGYASLGHSDRYLATVTHLDIVPAGDGWTGDPFKMRERDGYIIGRGVMDDKGPGVLCLYAMKYLKDRNIPLRYEVRVLLGVNEELGMEDVSWYLKNYPAPVFCFSPDANFPLCNGEKGITGGKITAKVPLQNIVDIKAGVAGNVIPSKAEAWLKTGKPVPTEDVSVEKDGELIHLTAKGIGGHASMPQGTRNAIGVLTDYILDNSLAREEEAEYLRLIKKLHDAPDGSLLGVDAKDGIFTPLTIIGGVIGVENGRMFQTYDCRYPTSTDGERVRAGLQAAAGDIAEVTSHGDNPPFYMSLDNPAVQVCIDAYNDVTGENAVPYTIGGGTYARDFPNAVSFGPEHPERPMPDFAGPIHGPDETACMEDFIEALKVYIITLLELEKLEF